MKKLPLLLIVLLTILIFLPIQVYSAPKKIQILKGNKQSIRVGSQSAEEIILKVTDDRSYPEKAVIKLKVLKGEVKLFKKTLQTDANGKVSFPVRAGYTPGETVIKAYVDKMPNIFAKLYFNVTLGGESSYKPTKKPVKKPVKKPNIPTKKITPIKPLKTPSTPKAGPDSKSEPALIIGFDGNNQQVELGATAPKDLAVQIMDEDGKTLKDVTVQFKVLAGQAEVIPPKTSTDAKGIASSKVKMGSQQGMVVVQVQVEGNEDLSTSFNLKGVSKSAKPAVNTPTPKPYTPSPIPAPTRTSAPAFTPTPAPIPTEPTRIPDSIKLPPKPNTRPRGSYSREPANIDVVAGNYQVSDPGIRLQQPVVVYVTDSDGNPTFATISFAVLRGDATIINREVKTDARGLASTFVIVNSRKPIKIVAEVIEKEGLSTIAYANTVKKEKANAVKSNNPLIRATTPSNTPGYPSSIAFYELRAKNMDSIQKTRVIQLEIGVSDFRNVPVSTAIKFTAIKGKVRILNPIVQTNSSGRGICYVEVSGSMGIFTIEAQSMENPDLRALFKSGPSIRTGPAPKVVRPGLETPKTTRPNDPGMRVKPPSSSGEAGKPALLAVVRGGGQKIKVRTKSPEPIVVLVTDAKGNPVKNTLISFFMETGRAVIHSPFARTNERGEAETYITPGKTAGLYELGARVRGNKSLKTTIRVEAVE